MALYLHTVAPRQGFVWLRRAFTLFFRRPLGFTAMLVAFGFAALVSLVLLPWVGSVLVLMGLPLLSLGFMVATRSALADGPVHPGLLVEPLRQEPARRRSLLQLCALYAVANVVVMLLAGWIDGGRFDRWVTLVLGRQGTPEEIAELSQDPLLFWGIVVRFGLTALLSIPFWHAPALVHWGGQGPGQALFSSALALWRTRWAFAAYLAGWVAAIGLFGMLAAVVFGLLGMPGMEEVAAMPAALLFSTAFYVSLYFMFTDTFGTPE